MTLGLPAIERIMTTVAECLREMFPEDFYKRCAYTASGKLSLLREAGAEGSLVGGDFAAFIVATAGNKAGLQGFGFGTNQCSHFWVEAEGRLIDVAPHFLPADASYPIVPMPGVAWDMARARPQALRYREVQRFPGSAGFSADPAIQKRGHDFVQLCRERFSQQSVARFPTWIVTGPASLEIAANKGNAWALGAKRFETLAQASNLPF